MNENNTMREIEESAPIVKTEIIDDEYSDSYTEEILPEMMVSVQVEEIDQAQALDFTPKPIAPPITKKKENRYQRRKKQPESPEERKERLERDRARKMWARHNETPEQRKARLEYHKKYKRKSRAKPKELPQSMKCERCPVKFNGIAEWQEHLKIHPWRDTYLNIGQSNQDPLNETENIIVKVEPIDIDDISINSNESPPISDFTPNKFEPTLDDNTIKYQKDELSYTIQCAIISKMFKGRSIDDICKLYNVTADVVNELWEERDKYQFQQPGFRSHRHMNAIIERNILEWLQHQRDNNLQISGKMIQNAAEGYAKELGFVAFDGSRKWLDRFKKKHHIVFGTRRRDYTATTDNKVKTQFFGDQWADARLGLSDDDIYTADEVGLFYNPSKNRIQKLRGKKFVQGCIKDRLSIFLCANASGTDKRKLLVCGTEDPLQNLHKNPQNLPVLYIRHSQAHFTTRMFEEYVKRWNEDLEKCNKKCLLILDRATIHTKLQLSHLKLLFVPYKSKNSLVPIRHGVYTRFREEFRRLILEDKVMKSMAGLDRNITCFEALSMLERAWDKTPPEVITMSLFSIGYDVTKPKNDASRVSKSDEENMCEILKNYDVEHYFTDVTLLDEYLKVDDDLLTGQGTNASVFGGNHKPIPKNEGPIGNNSADDKKAQTLQNLGIVRKYLESNDTTFKRYCELMDVEKFEADPSCSDS